ncbi:hemolysin family protein [Desulfococcaceae bacterium HSG7]|nr:hemolysin family protein [Desulfococcaceae bacterium HSG7]
MNLLIIVLIMLLLLLLKGFFSGSEIALVNCDKIKLHHLANQGHKGAMLVLKLFKTPDVLLGTTLVGTNISTIILTTLGTMLMIRHFGERGDLIAFFVYTPLLLILGEIVPKSVYQQTSNTISPIIVFPLRIFSLLFFPIIFIFSRVARLAARLTGSAKTDQSGFITRELVRSVAEMAERGSNIDAFDRGRIRRVIRFAETTVGEAMIPLTEMTAIKCNKTTREAILLVRNRGYNRLPVFEGNISNIFGIITLTTWDLLDPDLPDTPLKELIKPVHYVSAHQTIDILLPILRKRKDHMAIVVDEFGSAIGIITMEDVLEEVVGEIDVGYQFEEYLPKRKRSFETMEEGIYLMDSRFPISEANEVLSIELPAKEYYTIGGMVMARLRHIPKEGENIVESGYRFTVEKATERTIQKIRVERI